jgi:transcription antitermination factor NusA-like protein
MHVYMAYDAAGEVVAVVPDGGTQTQQKVAAAALSEAIGRGGVVERVNASVAIEKLQLFLALAR